MLDLTSLVTTGLNLAEPALIALASWIAAELAGLIGAKKSGEFTALVDETVRRAVRYGLDRAREAGKDAATVEVKNDLVREAVAFVAEQAPTALKKLGIDPASESGRARIAGWVRARLAEV